MDGHNLENTSVREAYNDFFCTKHYFLCVKLRCHVGVQLVPLIV
jgi:hypothetical protein